MVEIPTYQIEIFVFDLTFSIVKNCATSWAGREVVWMFAGRFAFNYNELDPEIWYGHSLGKSYKL